MRRRRELQPEIINFNLPADRKRENFLKKYDPTDLTEMARCEERQAITDMIAKLLKKYKIQTEDLHNSRGPSHEYKLFKIFPLLKIS